MLRVRAPVPGRGPERRAGRPPPAPGTSRGAARIDRHERTAAHRRRCRRRHRGGGRRGGAVPAGRHGDRTRRAEGAGPGPRARPQAGPRHRARRAGGCRADAAGGGRRARDPVHADHAAAVRRADRRAERRAQGLRRAPGAVHPRHAAAAAGSTQAQSDQLKAFGERFAQFTQTTQQALGTGAAAQAEQAKVTAERIGDLAKSNEQRLEAVRATVEQRLDTLRTENAAKLDQMRATVDEKLQTTLEQRLGGVVQAGVRPAGAGAQGPRRDADAGGRRRRPEARADQREVARHLGRGPARHAAGEVLAPQQYEANVETRPGSTSASSTRSACRAQRRRRAVLAAGRRQVPARGLAAAAGRAGARRCAGARRPRARTSTDFMRAQAKTIRELVRRAAAHHRLRDPVRAGRGPVRRDGARGRDSPRSCSTTTA